MRFPTICFRSPRLAAIWFALLALFAIAGCGQSTRQGSSSATAAPSTAGWQTYTDSTYHFKAVIPPGWRIGTVLNNVGLGTGGGDCEYDAVYFPPGDSSAIEPYVTVGMHEFMKITVSLKCPAPLDLNATTVGTVTISGQQATMYADDDSQAVSRNAMAQFGGHPFTFTLLATSPQHTAITADVPLYMGVLSGFVYHGS